MKTWVIFAALIAAASGAANADPRDDTLAGMQRCSTLGDRDKRLGCYDATMARAPEGAALAIPPSRQMPVVTASAPPPADVAPPRARSQGFMARVFGTRPKRQAQTAPEQFGSESIANGGAVAFATPMASDTIDQVKARLVAASFDSGFITVTLDNGQVWRQTENAGAVNLSGPPSSYTVIVARGSFGSSYAMRLSGRLGVVPVRRLR